MINPDSSHSVQRLAWIRALILLMLAGFTFQGHFNRVSIAVAGSEVFIGSNRLSEQEMGWVYTGFLVVYTLAMIPGGWVIDRWGPRRTLTGMGLGLGFFVMLTGALGKLDWPITQLFVPLIIIRCFAGALSAPLHPGTSRAAALWTSPEGRLTANGLITAGALLGIASASPVFGELMDRVGWPSAFLFCGAVLIGFSIVWHGISADSPHEHGWIRPKRSGDGPATSAVRYVSRFGDFRQLCANRALVLLSVSYGALGYFQYLFFYWIGFYFDDQLKLGKEQSREATFQVTLAMAVGMAVGGFVSAACCRRLGFRWGCRVMAISGMLASAVFGWLGVASTSPDQIVWFFAAALGSLGACESVFWTSASVLEPNRGGLAAAFLNTGANLGGLVAPALTPWIGNRYGWTAAIAFASVVCGLGGALWLLIDTSGEQSLPAPQ